MAIPKKSKEEQEREWAEFQREQEKVFNELLIEKGIKPRDSIQVNSRINVISNRT